MPAAYHIPTAEYQCAQFANNDPTDVLALCPTARVCPGTVVIQTGSSEIDLGPGDWLIQDVDGNFTSMSDDQFRATYVAG